MIGRRVIVAGERQSALFRELDDNRTVPCAVMPLILLALGDESVQLLFAHAEFARVILLIAAEVGKLALARRVIHHREQPQPLIVDQRLEQVDQAAIADFAAPMEIMVRLERPRRHLVLDGLAHFIEKLDARRAAVNLAHAERIEDGRDPGGGDFAVMTENRGIAGPECARPRHDVALEIVGMQLDETGNDEIALAIDCARDSRRSPRKYRQSRRPASRPCRR